MTRRPESRRRRRQRLRARRRRNLAGALLFAGALGLGASAGPRLAGLAVGAVYPEAVRVRELAVLGARRLTPAEVAAAAGLEPAARFDDVDAADLARRIEAHPWIARARVAAFPPGGLVVSVTEREPVATAVFREADGRGESRWWIDVEGVAFAPVADAAAGGSYPSIAWGEAEALAAPEGDAPEPHPLLAQGVRIAGATRDHGIAGLREVQLGGGDLRELPRLRLAGSDASVWLGGGELEAKLGRLARLLDAGLPEVAEASEIDLRFGERAVLRSDASRTGDAATGTRGGASASGAGPAG